VPFVSTFSAHGLITGANAEAIVAQRSVARRIHALTAKAIHLEIKPPAGFSLDQSSPQLVLMARVGELKSLM
jgi:hypothetical protein